MTQYHGRSGGLPRKSLLLAFVVISALLRVTAQGDEVITRQQFNELVDILNLTTDEKEAATNLFEGFEVSIANLRAGLKSDQAAIPNPGPAAPEQMEKSRAASHALTVKALESMAKLEHDLLNDLRSVAMAHPAEAWGQAERARERQRLLDQVGDACYKVDLVQLWRQSGLSTDTSKRLLADWEAAIAPSLREIVSAREAASKDFELHPPHTATNRRRNNGSRSRAEPRA